MTKYLWLLKWPQINPGYVTSSFLFDGTSDYFDISKKDIPSLRESIKGVLFKEIADSCNQCDCGKFPTKMIPAGIQLNDKKKPHSTYTIVKRDEYEKLKEQALITEKYQ